ncbi:hypothetical protein CYG49_02190 [Candidatus Saccharibacteria bacterium]|nr:MAG: hypothetical protein CYG49_02190 [Candidatus Saccharibacteria bacterium]
MANKSTTSGNDKVKLEIEVPRFQIESLQSLQGDDQSNQDKQPKTPPKDVNKLHDEGKLTFGGYTMSELAKLPAQPFSSDDSQDPSEKTAKTQPAIVSRLCLVVGGGMMLLALLFSLLSGTVAAMLFLLGLIVVGAGFVITKAAQTTY